MKKILLLVAHPTLKDSIVNNFLIERLEESNEPNITIRDLNSCMKDNTFNVDTEQKYLLEADKIIFQFPLYWYSYPALLKKWIDEVFTPGFAYGRKGEDLGTNLVGKQFGIITTIGGVEDMYTPGGIIGSSVNELLRHLQTTIDYVGGIYIYPLLIYGAAFLKDESNLEEVYKKYITYMLSDYIQKDKQYEKLVKLAYEYKAKGYY